MICCPAIQQAFVNVATTTIPYGLDRQAVYGRIPEVQVVYFIGGEYLISTDFSTVKYKDNTITVEHGGAASGFIIVK